MVKEMIENIERFGDVTLRVAFLPVTKTTAPCEAPDGVVDR